jgi:hypothetical protein
VEFLTKYFQGICDGTTQLSSAELNSNQLNSTQLNSSAAVKKSITNSMPCLSIPQWADRQTDSLLQSSAARDDDDDDDDIDDPRPVLLTNLSKPAQQQIRTRIATTRICPGLSCLLPNLKLKNNTSR